MITEAEIERFPAEKQKTIRETIERLVKNGRQLRYLMLMRDGSVIPDYEAIEIDADREAFGLPEK